MPNDRITSFECTYNLINYNAMSEATFNSNTIKSFSNLADLVESANHYNYFTLEHNYNVLDGSLQEFPNTFTTSYFSTDLSDESGEYINTTPNLIISFNQPQNAFGLTLEFEKDYPLEIEVGWLDIHNDMHRTIVHPNNEYFVVQIDFIDCTRIELEFSKTIPYRYIKLLSILFGQVFEWTENEIQQANLLLENDNIGDKLSINELSFKIIDDLSKYNLANNNGLHRYFQKRQEAIAYEWVNGTRLLLGNYFLDNFSTQDNLVSLNCVSYIGLLDNVNFNDGDIYNGTLAGEVLEDIFDVANIDNYLIDTETYNTPLYGTLKPMTCREALRQILFACGSEVDTTTEDGIVVTKTDLSITTTLTRSNKISTKITKKDYVHGVEIEYVNYKLSNESSEIVSEQLYPAGINTVVFNNAYANVVIKDSDNNIITPTILKKYYCVFNLEEDTTITITGNEYVENLSKVQVTNRFVESGESQTINTYSTTLCNAVMAKQKADYILDYLKYRLELDVQVITDNISMESRHWVENPNKEYASFIAWYSSRNLDLTGGFIDTAKMVGYYYGDYGYYYTGNELYTGEEFGII